MEIVSTSGLESTRYLSEGLEVDPTEMESIPTLAKV